MELLTETTLFLVLQLPRVVGRAEYFLPQEIVVVLVVALPPQT
jgi:hypothetical protein